MIRPPDEIVHLAYPDGSACCQAPGGRVLVLEDPSLWHAVPEGLRCPACELIYQEGLLHGFN